MEIEKEKSLCIVEIGAKPLMKQAFPANTSYFSTEIIPGEVVPAAGRHAFGIASIAHLWRLLQQADLIVCHPTFHAPWHWRWLSRALFDRRILHGNFPFVRAFGPQILRLRTTTPIAVIDGEDLPLIDRNNFFLLDRCKLYFKRELPADYWRLFMKTGHPQLPTPRFRLLPKYQRRIAKLKPLSIGLPITHEHLLPFRSIPKTVDVFFAGRVQGSSSIRVRGLDELLALRNEGVAVDIADRNLAPAEFYERCARAWLVWSPEGLGWDCFRHYEASACGSVPVINRQNIERYRPLRHAEHAIYYDIEEQGLTAAIRSALAAKEHLLTMADAGKTHVMAHHTTRALATHIICETLQPQASADFIS